MIQHSISRCWTRLWPHDILIPRSHDFLLWITCFVGTQYSITDFDTHRVSIKHTELMLSNISYYILPYTDGIAHISAERCAYA